jgi:hypothetical protein
MKIKMIFTNQLFKSTTNNGSLSSMCSSLLSCGVADSWGWGGGGGSWPLVSGQINFKPWSLYARFSDGAPGHQKFAPPLCEVHSCSLFFDGILMWYWPLGSGWGFEVRFSFSEKPFIQCQLLYFQNDLYAAAWFFFRNGGF